MTSPVNAPQGDRYPMDSIPPVDGANYGGPPDTVYHGVIPRYDAKRDADVVPKYTREYLQGLSTTINARLKMIDNDTSHYPDALAKTRRAHRCLTAVLILLGLLWLATSIVILVAVSRSYVKPMTGK
ncbi:hypothetical protein F5Y14DRAFT_410249 [Nemania sp. NC0429]|nr:hypothetical protein F5Y14DRAFT_410249 [Nemania sp. NC0429]